MTPQKEQINFNLENLNIKVIHDVITYLDIKWKNVNTGEKRIPTINEISIIARHCMEEAFKSEDKIFSMGGFEAEVINGIVGIKFVLTESNPLSKIFG